MLLSGKVNGSLHKARILQEARIMTESLQNRKRAFLESVFQGYEGPPFALRLWDGYLWASRPGATPVCTIVVRNPATLAALLSAPNERSLGEAFIDGGLDVEGDIFSAFSIAEHLFHRPRSLRRQIAETLAVALFGLGRWVRHGALSSRRRDRDSIAYHYDQPVAFFEPWLGQSMVYSCAYFRGAQEPLDQAQEQKLELVCKKLRLERGEHFLDIGCGWGSLALHAAGKRKARAYGITLSREQASFAKRQIERAGLGASCSVALRDYRELGAAGQQFDKIASVGMFEHVGLKNLPLYFRTAYSLLRPGGLMLNHGIARSPLLPARKDSFVSRYVFPGGRLVTLSETLRAAESQGLEVRDVENLREHYDLTLRQWVARLRQNTDSLLRLVSETTYRIWLLYMAGSAAAFRRGDIAVYQVLLSRPDKGNSRLPLSREDLYSAQPAHTEAVA
jgi:cyclopropane-fatty-acyl-phospholipid synthase